MDAFIIRSPKWTQSQPISTPPSRIIDSPLLGRIKVVHSEKQFVPQVTQVNKCPLTEVACVTNTNVREKNFFQLFLQRTEQALGRASSPLGNKSTVQCSSSLHNSSRNRYSMPSFRSNENKLPDTGLKVSIDEFGKISDYVNRGDEEALAGQSVKIMHTPPHSIPLPSTVMQLDDLGKHDYRRKPPNNHVQQPTLRRSPQQNPLIQRIQRDLNSPSAAVRLRALKAMKNPADNAYTLFDIPHEEQSIITAEERNPLPPTTIQEVMRDVVVFVEVRSDDDNRSAGVKKVISALGARVNDKLIKGTTHVIFKDGLLSTYKKAKRMNIPVVSILWVEACKNKLQLCDPLLYPISNVDRYENPELYDKMKPVRAMQPGAELTRRVRNKLGERTESTPKSNKNTAAVNGEETSSAKNKTDISHYFKLLRNKQTLNKDDKDAIRMSAGVHSCTGNDSNLPLTPINHLNGAACITPIINGKSDVEQDFSIDAFITPKNPAQAATNCVAYDDETPKASNKQRPMTRRLSKTLEIRREVASKTVEKSCAMDVSANQTSITSSPTKSSGKKRAKRRETTFTQKSLEMSTLSTDPQRHQGKKAIGRRRTLFTPQTPVEMLLETVTEADKTPQGAEKKTHRKRTLYTPLPLEMEMTKTADSSKRRRTLYKPKALDEELLRADEKLKATSRRCTLLPQKPIFEDLFQRPMVTPQQQKSKTPPTPNQKIRRRTKLPAVETKNAQQSTETQNVEQPPALEQLSTPAAPVITSPKKVKRRRTLYTPKVHDVPTSEAPNAVQKNTNATSVTPAVNILSEVVVCSQKPLTPEKVDCAVNAPQVEDKERNKRDSAHDAILAITTNHEKLKELVDNVGKHLVCIDDTLKRRTLLPRSASTEQQIYCPSLVQLRKSLTTPNLVKLVEEVKGIDDESDKTLVPNSNGDKAEAGVEKASPVEGHTQVQALNGGSPPTRKENGTAKIAEAPSTPNTQKKRKLYVPCNGLTTDFVPTASSNGNGATKRRRTIMPLEPPDTAVTQDRIATPKVKRAPRRSTLDFELPRLVDDTGTSSTRIVRTPAATLLKNSRIPDMRLPSIVCTNMHKKQMDVIREALKDLGSFHLENIVNDTTTHIVTLEPRRTLNMLRGLIRGLWILEYSWVIDSLHAGKWLCEESYEVKDFSRAVEICRSERQAFGSYYRCELFSQLGPFFLSANCGPATKDNMNELIVMCGGKMTTSRRKAKFILGHKNQIVDDQIYLTPYWVLDSITQMQIKPYRSGAEMFRLVARSTPKPGTQRTPAKTCA